MIVPSLVRRETRFRHGYSPQGEEDTIGKTHDNDYLAGTAEVGHNELFCRRDFERERPSEK